MRSIGVSYYPAAFMLDLFCKYGLIIAVFDRIITAIHITRLIGTRYTTDEPYDIVRITTEDDNGHKT